MSECVVLQADGTLIPTGQPASECAGYVLVSGTEYGSVQFMARLFDMPPTDQIMGVLVAAFGFILVCNVVASMVGSVVQMVSTDRH